MDQEHAIRGLANRLLDAIERGDVAGVGACYHPDLVVWHNTAGAESSREENLLVLQRLIAITDERVYSRRTISVFDGGFVEQHRATLRTFDGNRHAIDACLVCKVRDGQIVRIDEYFDGTQLAALRAAAQRASVAAGKSA